MAIVKFVANNTKSTRKKRAANQPEQDVARTIEKLLDGEWSGTFFASSTEVDIVSKFILKHHKTNTSSDPLYFQYEEKGNQPLHRLWELFMTPEVLVINKL